MISSELRVDFIKICAPNTVFSHFYMDRFFFKWQYIFQKSILEWAVQKKEFSFLSLLKVLQRILR